MAMLGHEASSLPRGAGRAPDPVAWDELDGLEEELASAAEEEAEASRERSVRITAIEAIEPLKYRGLAERPVQVGRTGMLRSFYSARVEVTRAVERQDGSCIVEFDADDDLGRCPEVGTLDLSGAWLLRALAVFIRRPPFWFHRDMARAAIHRGTPPFVAPLPSLGEDRLTWHLNEDKVDAVDRVLGRALTLVWGPPGTGKTEALAGAAIALMRRNQRVLILAPTNAAVNCALARVRQLHPGPAEQVHEDIARLGRGLLNMVDAIGRTGPPSIVGATCYNPILGRGLEGAFDAVLVDEASATALPLAYVAGGCARTRIAFFGDFRQLGPVVKSESSRVRSMYENSVFEAHSIADAVQRDEAIPHLVTLTEQRRMARSIMRLVSDFAYLGRLTKPHGSAAAPAPEGVSTERIALVNLGEQASCHSERGSRKNETSAACVRGLLERLIERNGAAASTQPGCLPLAIITPYVAQVALLRETCQDLVEQLGGEITTIHRMQGREAELVILDLVDAPGLPLSRFLRATSLSEPGGRLLTVGLSRARSQLLIVGAFPFLFRAAPRDGVLARLRQCLQELDVLELSADEAK